MSFILKIRVINELHLNYLGFTLNSLDVIFPLGR